MESVRWQMPFLERLQAYHCLHLGTWQLVVLWHRPRKVHKELCYSFALKGQTFDCPDNMKGRVGPYFKEFLLDLNEHWLEQIAAAREIEFGGAAFLNAYVGGMTYMIGLTWLKFGFIDALPWLVWRTGSILGMKLI